MPTRTVSSSIEFEVTDPTDFVLAVAVARGVPIGIEALTVSLDAVPLDVSELDEGSTRLHAFHSAPGTLRIDYYATVTGRAAAPAVDPLDAIRFVRPSRYAQSDSLTDFARERFGGLAPHELVRVVPAWVAGELRYDSAATPVGGSAIETLESGTGVCRDFAHVTTALFRALDVPARMVSVYAPQLDPMDFHAVTEVLLDGRWLVVDSTRLAPRQGMVRIATGRDAADTAFETNTLADVTLIRLSVTASADVEYVDDPEELVELG